MKDYCALVAYKEPKAGAYFRRRNLIEVVNNWLRNFPEADIVVTEQILSGEREACDTRWADYMAKFELPDQVKHVVVELGYPEFHKTLILNEAISQYGDYKFYILADADAFLDLGCFEFIREHRDEENLVFPYASVLYLDESDTREAVAGRPLRPGIKNHGVVISRQTGLCNIFSKKLYLAVNKFDEEFVNWGAEDDAFCFKVKRIGRQVIRNSTGNGTVLHLFHPKVNTEEYTRSADYIRNRKLCACIRRMSDDDFDRMIRGVTSLNEFLTWYDANGVLKTSFQWPCVPGMYLTVDTTIYDVKQEGITFTKLMAEVCKEDGPEVAVQFLDNVLLALHPLSQEQLDELRGIRENLVKQAKEGKGEG